ncbi:H-NS histone family protein [Tropicimonas aquimaris]|uniref:H-NS family nucleoid-associated regulatory protein n=1 Tax=Tropicimonas aquimaris TaxID=914152 RepID=A0ABW3IJA0_9RHOB
MSIDLSNLSRAELEQLAKDVQTAIADLAKRERKLALEALEKTASEHGFKLEELTGAAGKMLAAVGAKGKSKNPPKYRNPEEPSQTWTGRGRKPAWIKDAEDAGVDLSTFEI